MIQLLGICALTQKQKKNDDLHQNLTKRHKQ
jgi:hypothetical protein